MLTCRVSFASSHLPESYRCPQVCWCSFGPGWRTRRKGPGGCLLLPCSPCSHHSHPQHWRSWSWCQPGLRKPNRMHAAASHSPCDRVTSPKKKRGKKKKARNYYCSVTYETNISDRKESLMQVLALGVRPSISQDVRSIFWDNELHAFVFIWRLRQQQRPKKEKKRKSQQTELENQHFFYPQRLHPTPTAEVNWGNCV